MSSDIQSKPSADAQLIAAAILSLQMSTVNAAAFTDELIELLFSEDVVNGSDRHDQVE